MEEPSDDRHDATEAIISAKLIALVGDTDGPPRSPEPPQELIDATRSEEHPPRTIVKRADLVQASTEELVVNGVIEINELFKRATIGESLATTELYRLATLATRHLYRLALNGNPNLKAVAATKPVWPVLANRKPETMAKAKELMDELELGKDCSINFSPETKWALESPATQWAIEVHSAVVDLRNLVEGILRDGNGAELDEWKRQLVDLPPLTKATAEEWFNVGFKPYIAANFPEIEKESDWANVANNPSYTSAAQQRAAILKAIKRALKSLANS